VSGNLRSNSIEGLRMATVAGQGICLLPKLSVIDDLKSGRLVHLLPEFGTAETAIQAVYPAGRHLSVKVRTFLDFLVNACTTTRNGNLQARPAQPKADAA